MARVLMRVLGAVLGLALLLAQAADGLEVALFASSGCYSHDAMMKEVGEQFGGHNVTWLQAYIFEFGFGEMPLPAHWGRVQVSRPFRNGEFASEGVGLGAGSSEHPAKSSVEHPAKELCSVEVMNEFGGFLLWLGNVPLDWSRWWDLRGPAFFLEILKYHQRYCTDFVQSAAFQDYRAGKKVDLLVIDHFLQVSINMFMSWNCKNNLQECVVGAASLLNASTVQFSNWPMADGYITSLNVPANPSATPKTGNRFSSVRAMDFGTRVRNSLFHGFILLARYVQAWVVRGVFAEWGHEVGAGGWSRP